MLDMRTTSARTTLVALALSGALPLSVAAQQPAQRQPGQRQRTVCIAGDTSRALRRTIGDSLRVQRAGIAGARDTSRVTGGTPRSQSYPEYDVVLDIPNVCVERIHLRVDSVTARLALNARVSNLIRVDAGADVLIGNVDLTIQGVRAQALLLVDLDDVVYIVDQTLTFVDNHPEIVRQLGSTLQNAAGAVGGTVGTLLDALLLGTSSNASGDIVQRLVDRTTGQLIERTISTAGRTLGERTIGSLTSLPTVSETTNAAGQLVRQVRDQAGAIVEYTLDRATNRLSNIRLVSGGMR
jgi:hypothetical protein